MGAGAKLLKDITTKKPTWDPEKDSLKGIKNLTLKDLDMLKMYAETYEKTGWCVSGFLPLSENAICVLEKYGLIIRKDYKRN